MSESEELMKVLEDRAELQQALEQEGLTQAPLPPVRDQSLGDSIIKALELRAELQDEGIAQAPTVEPPAPPSLNRDQAHVIRSRTPPPRSTKTQPSTTGMKAAIRCSRRQARNSSGSTDEKEEVATLRQSIASQDTISSSAHLQHERRYGKGKSMSEGSRNERVPAESEEVNAGATEQPRAGAFAYYPHDHHAADSMELGDSLMTSTDGSAPVRQRLPSREPVEANPVDNAETVIVATSVSKDVMQRNKRRMIVAYGIAILAAIGLVVGIVTWSVTRGGRRRRNGAENDVPEVDPRCLLPIEEQTIFAVCDCSGSAKDYVQTELEEFFYSGRATEVIMESGIIDQPFVRDSCDPGNQALLWAASFSRANVTLDEVRTFNKIQLLQVWGLGFTYLVLGGPNWIRSSTAVEDSFFVCTWEVVTCSFLGRVVELNLADNNVVGQLPVELGLLPFMIKLDMARNPGLNGTIPNVEGRFRGLHELTLTSANLSGTLPDSLASLPVLDALDLSENHLTGSIPSTMGLMTNLDHLILNRNRLTGSIPTELGQLSSVELLDLSSNLLTGAIPSEVGLMGDIELFDLRNNVGINGTLPAVLGWLPRLGTTFLWNTTLEGGVSESFCTNSTRDRSYDVIVVNCAEGRITKNCSCCDSLVACGEDFPDFFTDLGD